MVELDPLASVSILGKPGQLPAVLAEKHRDGAFGLRWGKTTPALESSTNSTRNETKQERNTALHLNKCSLSLR